METTIYLTTKLPHMGNFIKNIINQQNISSAEISRRISIKQSTLNGYFVQETLQTRIIFKLSQALKRNLFADLMMYLPFEIQNTNTTPFQKTIENQQQEIYDLKKEIAIYKEILTKRL